MAICTAKDCATKSAWSCCAYLPNPRLETKKGWVKGTIRTVFPPSFPPSVSVRASLRLRCLHRHFPTRIPLRRPSCPANTPAPTLCVAYCSANVRTVETDRDTNRPTGYHAMRTDLPVLHRLPNKTHSLRMHSFGSRAWKTGESKEWCHGRER